MYFILIDPMFEEEGSFVGNIKVLDESKPVTNDPILLDKLIQKLQIIRLLNLIEPLPNLINIPIIKIINFFAIIFLIKKIQILQS